MAVVRPDPRPRDLPRASADVGFVPAVAADEGPGPQLIVVRICLRPALGRG
jgi:hypothetical protein